MRQTLNFDDTRQRKDGGANQFDCSCSPERLVLTVGKFSVTDVFDTNRYAHDPRGDFLNWALLDAGSFDYAADAWGYTVAQPPNGTRGGGRCALVCSIFPTS